MLTVRSRLSPPRRAPVEPARPTATRCLRHDAHHWNLCDQPHRDIDHLVNTLQLWDVCGLLNSPDHDGDLSLHTTGMSTTLSVNCNRVPGISTVFLTICNTGISTCLVFSWMMDFCTVCLMISGFSTLTLSTTCERACSHPAMTAPTVTTAETRFE